LSATPCQQSEVRAIGAMGITEFSLRNDFSLRAIDGERGDDLDAWAARLSRLLDSWRELDEGLLGSWFATARSKAGSLKLPVGYDAEQVMAFLRKGRSLNIHRRPMPDLGYHASAWNGVDAVPLRFLMHCCRHGVGLPNGFELELKEDASGGRPNGVSSDLLEAMVIAVAEALEPAWVEVTSREHGRLRENGLRPFMSWFLYLRGQAAASALLPDWVRRNKVGMIGWLLALPAPVVVADEVSVARALAVDKALSRVPLDIPIIPR
jgi:hypothetical protein